MLDGLLGGVDGGVVMVRCHSVEGVKEEFWVLVICVKVAAVVVKSSLEPFVSGKMSIGGIWQKLTIE